MTSAAFPKEWGWAKLHLKAAGLKAIGYYYRDKTAGPSFKIVCDLGKVKDEAAAVEAMRERAFRAESTFRLGAHETLGSEGLPEDDDVWQMLEEDYESGESAAGPHVALVLWMRPRERKALGLPVAPPGMEHYL